MKVYQFKNVKKMFIIGMCFQKNFFNKYFDLLVNILFELFKRFSKLKY